MVFLNNHLFNASPWWKTHGALRLKKRQISAAKTFVAATRGRTAARPPRGCKWWKLRCSSTKRSQIWGTQKMKSKKQESPKNSPQKVPGFMYWIGEATILPHIFLPQRQSVGFLWVPKLALRIGEGIFVLEKLDDDFFWKAARNAIFLSIKNLGLKI